MLPDTLRQGNSTFVDLRATLDDLDPLLQASRPAAAVLPRFFRQFTPLLNESTPTFQNLSAIVHQPGAFNDATDAVQHLPQLQRIGSPAFSKLDHGDARGPAGDRLPAALLARPRRLVPRLRPVGGELRRERPLRARHADLRRLPVPGERSGGTLRAGAAVAAARRPHERLQRAAARAPPASRAPTARTRTRPPASTATPRTCCPAHDLDRLPSDEARAGRRPAAGRPRSSCSCSARAPRATAAATYRVRAIFDSASFLVPGEDVKVAGVKVGAIESLDVTPQNKAAIVLRIDDPAFQDFKQDAFCTIRLQSLIGEKFVACIPTQPKSAQQRAGAGAAKDRARRRQGPVPAAGDEHVGARRPRHAQQHHAAAGAPALRDHHQRARRRPGGQRRGAQRGDPARGPGALPARQSARDPRLAEPRAGATSRATPTPRWRRWRAQSQSISDFIDKAGATAAATAARGDALEQNFAKFPAFLTQLRPTMRRLGEFAAAGTPVMTRPARGRAVDQHALRAARPVQPRRRCRRSARSATSPTRAEQALPAAEPIIRDIRGFADEAKPFARTSGAGAGETCRDQHGIERLLDVILYTLGTSNGFDSLGHYLRTF